MISIIIPNYNTDIYFFKQCIDSIVQQTFQDFEIIFVDNGSSENNLIFYREYLNKLNKDVKFLVCERQRNKKNLSIALNMGITNSKYDFIARMDADDVMVCDRLEKQIKYLMNNPQVDILGGQLEYMHDASITNHPLIITNDIPINSIWFINHPSVMFKKDKIVQIGSYKEEPEFIAEDYELWTRSIKNNLVIHNLNDVIIKYRLHNSNLTFKDKSNPYYEILLDYIRKGYIQYCMETK